MCDDPSREERYGRLKALTKTRWSVGRYTIVIETVHWQIIIEMGERTGEQAGC